MSNKGNAENSIERTVFSYFFSFAQAMKKTMEV